jgi:hypothetical protein
MSVLTPILLLLLAFSTQASIEFSSKTLSFGNLLPDESKTLNLQLTNTTDKPIYGDLILDNPGLNSEERFGRYIKKNQEASLVDWLTLNEKTIKLGAKESKTIELTLTAPEASAGDYRAWLFIKTDNNSENKVLEWPYPEDRVAITAQLNQPEEYITLDSIQNAFEIRGPIIRAIDEISPALSIDLRLINKSPINIETHGQCTLLTKEAQPIMSAPLLIAHTGAYEKTRVSCLFSHYLPKDQYLVDIDLNHNAPFINATFKNNKRVAVYIRTKDERLLMDADARLLIPDVVSQSSFNTQTKETDISIQNLYEPPITLRLLAKSKNESGHPSIINQPLLANAIHQLSMGNDSPLVISIKEDRKRIPLVLTPKLAPKMAPLTKNTIEFAPQISIKEWNNNAHIFTIISYSGAQEIKTATLKLHINDKKDSSAVLKTSVPIVLPTHGHSPVHLVIPTLDAGDYQVTLSIINKKGVISAQKYDLQVNFSNQFKVYHSKANRYIRQFISNN